MARLFQLQPVTWSTADIIAISTTGGGTLSCLLSSASGVTKLLTKVSWYLAAPSSQTLTVYDGTSSGTAIFATGVNSSQGDINWANPLRGAVGNAVTVVLTSATGGGRVYMNISGYPEA